MSLTLINAISRVEHILRDDIEPLVHRCNNALIDKVEKPHLWSDMQSAIMHICNESASVDEAQELCRVIWNKCEPLRGAVRSGFVKATGQELKTGGLQRTTRRQG